MGGTAGCTIRASDGFMEAYGAGLGFGDVDHVERTRAGDSVGGTSTRVAKAEAALPAGSTAVAIAKAAPTFAEVLAIECLDRWLPGALAARGRVLWLAILGDVDATTVTRVDASRLAIRQFGKQLEAQVTGTVRKRHDGARMRALRGLL